MPVACCSKYLSHVFPLPYFFYPIPTKKSETLNRNSNRKMSSCVSVMNLQEMKLMLLDQFQVVALVCLAFSVGFSFSAIAVRNKSVLHC